MTEDEYRLEKLKAIDKWRELQRAYERVVSQRTVARWKLADAGTPEVVIAALARLDCETQRKKVDDALHAVDEISLTAEAQAFQVQTLAEGKLQ